MQDEAMQHPSHCQCLHLFLVIPN